MPYIYPHTDLNQQNLDWMIGQIKEIRDLISSIVATGSGNVVIVTDPNDITDQSMIYVYMGLTTASWTKGHMYKYVTGSWTDLGLVFPDYPLAMTAGGTGATNNSDARTNLGVTPANIGAEPAIQTTNPLAITKGGTGANNAADAVTNLGITAASIGAEPAITKLPISKGGTNATTAAAARSNLGVQEALTSTNPLPIDKGGTNANDAATARSNLGITPANIGAEPVITSLPIAKGGTGGTTQQSACLNLKAVQWGSSTLSSGASVSFTGYTIILFYAYSNSAYGIWYCRGDGTIVQLAGVSGQLTIVRDGSNFTVTNNYSSTVRYVAMRAD